MNGPIDIRGVAELTDRVSPILRQISAGMRRVVGESNLSRMSAQARTLTGAMGNLGVAVGGVAAAGVRLGGTVAALGVSWASLQGLVTGFAFGTVKAFAAAGSGLADLSARTGMSVEKLQELRYAARMAGSDSGSLASGLIHLNKVLADARAGKNKLAAEYFQRMGIDLRKAKIEDILPKIAEAFRKNGNEAQRTAAAIALFGQAGVSLIPMLTGGKKSLEEMAKQANDVGIVLSKDEVEAASELSANMDTLGAAVAGVGVKIGAALAPVLGPIIKDMIEWLKVNKEWLATNIAKNIDEFTKPLRGIDIKQLAKDFGDTFTKIDGYVQVIGGWGTVFSGLGLVLGAQLLAPLFQLGGALANILKVLLALIPAGAGLPLLLGGALIIGAIYNWEEFSAAIGKVKEGFNELMDGKIKDGLSKMFEGVLQAGGASVKGLVKMIGDALGIDLIAKIEEVTKTITDALDKNIVAPFRDAMERVKAMFSGWSFPGFSAPSVPETPPAPGENKFRPPAAGPMPLPPQRTGSLIDQPGAVVRAAQAAGAVPSPAQTVRGEGTVTVRFSNAPPGTQADTSSSGGLFKLRQGDMGYAMAGVG